MLIHQDLKPDNIFSQQKLKICDLGLARGQENEEDFKTEYVLTRCNLKSEYSWTVNIYSDVSLQYYFIYFYQLYKFNLKIYKFSKKSLILFIFDQNILFNFYKKKIIKQINNIDRIIGKNSSISRRKLGQLKRQEHLLLKICVQNKAEKLQQMNKQNQKMKESQNLAFLLKGHQQKKQSLFSFSDLKKVLAKTKIIHENCKRENKLLIEHNILLNDELQESQEQLRQKNEEIQRLRQLLYQQ